MKSIVVKQLYVFGRWIMRPIISEFPFFIIMIVLIDYWAFYSFIIQYLINGDLRLLGEYDYAMLRFISISFVYSYLFTWIVWRLKSKFLKYSIYTFGALLLGIDLFHFLSFKNTLLNPVTFMLMFETNLVEVSGFFKTYLLTSDGLFAMAITLCVIGGCYLLERKRDVVRNNLIRLPVIIKCCFSASLLIFFVGGLFSFRYYYPLIHSRTVEDIDRWSSNNMQYADRITNLFYCYNYVKVNGQIMPKTVQITREALNSRLQFKWYNDSVNIVLVIGESFIKSHSSIYGYSLKTNPILENELENGRLFAFSDVISPYMLTFEAIRNIMSMNSIGDGENWYDYPFFPALFHRLGYRTLFWDNQDDTQSKYPFDFTLDTYLHGAEIALLSYDMQHPQVSMFDHELIENFKSFWTKNANGALHFVLFHLQGQHFCAEDRYPQTRKFVRFKPDSISRNEVWMTNDKKQEIAHYDNCTYYNDYVLGQIIKLFNDSPSVIVYLSDHGENLYDKEDRKIRNQNDLHMYEIPFFIWCSDKYREQHPDIVKAIQEAYNKPFMTDNICHLLMRLGGVESVYYSKKRDILSSHYQCPPRIIAGCMNYDEMKKK